MCRRMDKPEVVTAAALKLARLIYTMLTKGEEYTNLRAQAASIDTNPTTLIPASAW
jgi:hypothetical protein